MMPKLSSDQKVLIQFLATMGVLCAVYFIWFVPRAWTLPIVGPNYSRFVHYSMLTLTEASALLLRMMGHGAETFNLRNIDLYESAIDVHIRNFCLGIDMMAMFTALVISFPGKWKNRFWFIPLGLMGIHAINILRVTILCVTTIYFDHHQFIDHHNIFNGLATLFIFLMFVKWVKMSGSGISATA
jgi:exosortase/archaeosortase family protein